MAYPYGQSNEAVREQAAALFRMAFTIEEGVNDHATSLLSLKRTMVQHGDTVADICLRAAYGRSAIAKVRTMISRAVGGPAKRTRV
jgi:hypothetical protein